MIRFSLTMAVWCTSVTIAILLAGCGSSSQPDAASTPGAPTEVPKRSSTGSAVKPPAGLGNAQGRVLIRMVNLWKTDLKPLSPQVGASVKASKPELKWQAYLGATQYKVSITGSGSSFGDLETASTNITSEKALLDGEYKWKVEALNGQGTKIAENAHESIFNVVGTGASSKVELVQPRRDALVDGKVKFVWKSNPQAMVNQIYLSQVGNNTPILSFVPVEGTEYTPTTPLANGQYFWSISAKRDGDQIAASELIPFTVK